MRIGVVALRPPAPPIWEGYLVVEDGVGLKWSAREGEDVIAWNVYRKDPPETEFRLVGSSRGTSYHDTGLEPDRLYVYALTALDSAFRETPFSQELSVTFARAAAPAEPQRPAVAWRVRRTRLVALVGGGGGLAFERPADVVVGPLSGNVYVADSGPQPGLRLLPQGVFQRTWGRAWRGERLQERPRPGDRPRREPLRRRCRRRRGPDLSPSRAAPAAAWNSPAGGGRHRPDRRRGRAGRAHLRRRQLQQPGLDRRARGRRDPSARPARRAGEFSAPTFCAVDAAGNLYVADCLNARVQVFAGTGEFVRAFGRAERGPGGFGRPKGVAVSAAGEVYVADSWLNTVQVFDAEGRFVADPRRRGRPAARSGSPNGVALGPGNRVYVAERLAARLQIREIDRCALTGR